MFAQIYEKETANNCECMRISEYAPHSKQQRDIHKFAFERNANTIQDIYRITHQIYNSFDDFPHCVWIFILEVLCDDFVCLVYFFDLHFVCALRGRSNGSFSIALPLACFCYVTQFLFSRELLFTGIQ